VAELLKCTIIESLVIYLRLQVDDVPNLDKIAGGNR